MSNSRKKRRVEAGRRMAAKQSGRMFSTECTVSFKAQPGEGEESKAPTFEINAYNGGPMKPDYQFWPTPVVVDLAGLKAAEPVAVLLDHSSRDIVGQSTSVKITKGEQGSVMLAGVVTGDATAEGDPAHKVVTHAGNGFVWKASMGVDSERFEKVEGGETVNVNGREFSGPLYVLRAGTIAEVSLLSVAADETSRAKIAATAAGKEMNMEFHDWLKAKEFDPADLEDKQREHLLSMWKAEEKETARQETLKAAPKEKESAELKKFDLNDERYDAIKARNARNETIRSLAMKFATDNPELVENVEKMEAAAIADETSPESFGNLLYRLRGEQLQAPNFRHPSDLASPAAGREVFEAALCMSGSLPDIDKHYDERTLDAAHKKWRGTGLGLGELLVHAAKRNGDYEGYSHKNVERLLRAAFQYTTMRAAGPSTFDVAGILANVANKFIVSYFDHVGSAWRSIAATRNVTDFKAIASHSLIGDYSYALVAPGGEITHATEGETDYANQAATYARMFAVSRTDIVNDDLNAFTQITKRLGRGGAIALNEVFWTEFMDNASFFVAANSNYYADALANLSSASLKVVEALFMNQTDPSGKPMGILPTVLLVPPALKRTALELMNSSETRPTGEDDIQGFPTANTFQNNYEVAVTPYLSNSLFTGNSALAWYLIGPPQDIATVEVAFLNGVERPTVESAQADFNQLGIQMRGIFDFGVTKQEYRGGAKSKGEA